VRDYASVRISEGARRSKVDAITNGIRLSGLTPKLPFPITNSNFIMLYDSEGKARLILEDYSKLDNESRNTLEASVLLSTFKPTISKVMKIDIRGDELDWNVVVGGGELTINTKGRRNVMLYPGKIVLTDVKDNIYEMNLRELDRRSQRLIAATI
jgi:ATP-binding cassette subfamily C protein